MDYRRYSYGKGFISAMGKMGTSESADPGGYLMCDGIVVDNSGMDVYYLITVKI